MGIKKTKKLKTLKNIKNSLVAHCAKLGPAKKMVHGPTRASHNSCPVVNIEQIKSIYKFFKIYTSGTSFVYLVA
jgi:hypothetical protein